MTDALQREGCVVDVLGELLIEDHGVGSRLFEVRREVADDEGTALLLRLRHDSGGEGVELEVRGSIQHDGLLTASVILWRGDSDDPADIDSWTTAVDAGSTAPFDLALLEGVVPISARGRIRRPAMGGGLRLVSERLG